MKIIIPMAGKGERFVNANYKEPKPIIKIRGKRLIEYVCDMFDRENDEFIFICNDVHLRESDLYKELEKVVKKYTILSMAPHKFGPVFSVYTMVYPYVKKDEPFIISHCDTPFTWDYKGFKEFVKGKDGCLVSCRGFHPHSLSSTMWAHSRTDGGNRVYEVKEKACYTDNHFNEHASAGVYYFRKGEYIFKYFKQLIDENINYNGEFYITLVYNLLIRDGLSVYSFLNDRVLSFGTPCDVQNFEAWQTILDGGQVQGEFELLQCYQYWKQYRESCK
ncbi:MAG: NTP transferase domain-containing protein [Bacteroidales bacterium]